MTTLELETPYGWSDDLFAEVMADVARMLREHGVLTTRSTVGIGSPPLRDA